MLVIILVMLLLFRISLLPDHAGVSSARHSGSCFQIRNAGEGDISVLLRRRSLLKLNS
jgi:hypothetical protein